MNVQSDRAEQAKALIERAENIQERHMYTSYAPWKDSALPLIDKLAAALSASGAEVARLETGIAEAQKIYFGDEFDRIDKAEEMERALSQPATDTNGAHAHDYQYGATGLGFCKTCDYVEGD